MSAPRILVTPRSLTAHGHPALARLRNAGFEVVIGPAGRQPSEAELLAFLPGCVGYLAGVEPVTARVLAAAPTLRVIARNGVGIDNIDLAAAQARGIAVRRAEGANSRGVADLTLGLMLALARALPAAATTATKPRAAGSSSCSRISAATGRSAPRIR